MKTLRLALIVVTLWLCVVPDVYSQPGPDQTPELLRDEAETVYIGNLARRQNGQPPLRWNLQLTRAARWFSWDSVENRPGGYCGHQDTRGFWPDYRAREWGYLGGAGAENAFCGYVTPQQAIDGWLASPGHRANLLHGGHREIGLGYYRRLSDGRGYVAQMFGNDSVYTPLIIENEAPATNAPNVSLYLYNPTDGGLKQRGPAIQMRLSNDRCLSSATWEPYASEKAWTLTPGAGWRTVYVQTRDAFNRTATVSDTIYLGANPPLTELGGSLMSMTQPAVSLYGLDGQGLPYVEISPGWLMDDADPTFNLWWGLGERVNDAAAWGGTAFRLRPGDGESFAWLYTTDFYKNTPFVAYFRLKVNSNVSPGEVARLSVKGGGVEQELRSLKGTDFSAANTYQEFRVPFTFFESSDVFLMFQVWRSGNAEVALDAVTVFSAPQPVTSPLTWNVPGGNYRGQGLWVRYSNGGDQFSVFSEANTEPVGLSVSPGALTFLAAQTGATSPATRVSVMRGCGAGNWQVSSDSSWLLTQAASEAATISVNAVGLATGTHTGALTFTASGATPVSVPVTLLVVDELFSVYLPAVRH
jgi:uncharacterized protein YkwD